MLCNFMNLQLNFTGDTLIISQSLMAEVILTSLSINQLSILLNDLEHGDGLNNQLATDLFEFIKLLTVLFLAFLCPDGSLL